MKINVTQENIDQGKPLDCESCAVALAVKDALKAITDAPLPIVSVHNDYFQFIIPQDSAGPWENPKVRFSLPLDKPTRRWVKRFDNNKPTWPFSFELTFPEQFNVNHYLPPKT